MGTPNPIEPTNGKGKIDEMLARVVSSVRRPVAKSIRQTTMATVGVRFMGTMHFTASHEYIDVDGDVGELSTPCRRHHALILCISLIIRPLTLHALYFFAVFF